MPLSIMISNSCHISFWTHGPTVAPSYILYKIQTHQLQSKYSINSSHNLHSLSILIPLDSPTQLYYGQFDFHIGLDSIILHLLFLFRISLFLPWHQVQNFVHPSSKLTATKQTFYLPFDCIFFCDCLSSMHVVSIFLFFVQCNSFKCVE